MDGMDGFMTPYERRHRDGWHGLLRQRTRWFETFDYHRGYQDGKRERAALHETMRRAFSMLADGRLKVRK